MGSDTVQETGAKSRPKQPEAEDRCQGRRFSFGLQLQFQAAMGALFLMFCLITALLIYNHEKQRLADTALRKSFIVLAAVEATRSYVREVLRPQMYEILGDDAFVLEAMSTSYITRAVMERFNTSLPQYRYRRVALNARNPDSDPTPLERELIEHFREHPDTEHWQGIRESDASVSYVHARPVYMKNSCLKCHGRVADAPAALTALYGSDRGFGYEAGGLSGISVVSIPVDVAFQSIRKQALSAFWVMVILMALLYVLISYLFHRMVVRSLKDLLNVFRRGLVNEEEIALLNRASSTDEIHELTDAATELTSHLSTTRQQLADYTEELEERVADRTRDLEESRVQLVEQVKTRNRELRTLNEIAELITRSLRLSDILPGVLEMAAGLIPAEGAAIYRLSGSGERANLELEVQRNAEKLAPRLVDREVPEPGQVPQSLAEAIWIAADGDMSMFVCRRNKNCINVPLVCRERVLGVMTFVGVDMQETSDEQKELLLSVGKQVGITIDSLRNVTALVQHKELLQSVFDGIPDVMVLMDRNMVIRMANRAYLQRHGYTLEQAIGRKCLALDGGCDCSLAGTRLSDAMATRRQTREEVTTEKGEIFRVYYYPILDESGEIWGILRYAKEITLEKQVESRIQQTEKMAALGQLAAGVAHEINNPLGIIRCYTDLLRRQLQHREQSLQDLEIIEKQAGNCLRIVSDLLNFSRSRKAAPVSVDVNQAVAEVVQMVQQQFEKKGTVIRTELEAALPETDLELDRIKQVFLNLMMNAHQALDGRSGRIVISTAFVPESASIAVAVGDDGPGIPPEIVARIFDPFFSTKQTGEGTGLGLSVSYGIVKEHGGEIEVRSNPGKWTEFVVILPVRHEMEKRP